jgi:hypothetical protein
MDDEGAGGNPGSVKNGNAGTIQAFGVIGIYPDSSYPDFKDRTPYFPPGGFLFTPYLIGYFALLSTFLTYQLYGSTNADLYWINKSLYSSIAASVLDVSSKIWFLVFSVMHDDGYFYDAIMVTFVWVFPLYQQFWYTFAISTGYALVEIFKMTYQGGRPYLEDSSVEGDVGDCSGGFGNPSGTVMMITYFYFIAAYE